MEKQLTGDEAEEMVKKVFSLVDSMPVPRSTKVRRMLDGPIGTCYFTAPASARVDYHSCFPGGLVYHSLKVLDNLRKLAEAFCPGRWPDHKLAFVALFHDLGKAGDGVFEYYIPNPNNYGRDRGFLYEINRDCVYMPTSERGLFLLQNNGIGVSQEEYLAIRLNDGMYDQANKNYAMNEPDLALLVHMADRWACSQEKKEREEQNK